MNNLKSASPIQGAESARAIAQKKGEGGYPPVQVLCGGKGDSAIIHNGEARATSAATHRFERTTIVRAAARSAIVEIHT